MAMVETSEGVTLVGGGPVTTRDLRLALRRAPVIVAADGGADRLIERNLWPDAVIGDLDSLSPRARALVPDARLHHVAEQESTDFDKALRNIAAPFVLGVGFAGGRADHWLAVLNSLVRHAERPCIIIGRKDVTFAAPRRPLAIRMTPGEPVSLFPLARVAGRAEGLTWALDGPDFTPAGRIGTSNRASAARVRLEFDRPGMLVILPRRRLAAAVAALRG